MKKSCESLCITSFAAAMLLIGGCNTVEKKAVAQAAPAPLLNTPWRLTQVGEVAVPNPPGNREVYFALQSQNTTVAGFSGCNRMFGHYVLDGERLKFDQMGGTKMFCDVRMELEQRYLAMFEFVASWKITGNSLQLLDSAGKTVAGFEASAAPATP